MADFYSWQDDSLILRCHLQPKASNDAIVGLHDDSVKIRITAPPIEGKANAHLIKFLAKQFGVAKSSVTILKGELGRQKRVKIEQPKKFPETLTIEHH
ncbi:MULTISPECIES: DUF167 domain-containing protein [Amphritea]|jgi:uncharacterized protein (TIGR00251 family)|uniref:DUF167 domain-containing protein n=1 Tax=Amphritea TaxID=515417 RepID=UPI001C06A1C7|nr:MULTISPECIES: DUF167 domain-containing protein [Amphritea]MBU2965659.1 YggU family protein [Amphritea atlantica]MDO6417215.1 DUF167 domain-containing protein [Amphritea sp. 2_MG-2023]MDX2423315.1 DUF167 domain-containing protein [Amphritea sp.]